MGTVHARVGERRAGGRGKERGRRACGERPWGLALPATFERVAVAAPMYGAAEIVSGRCHPSRSLGLTMVVLVRAALGPCSAVPPGGR